jgi:hypothetical protein
VSLIILSILYLLIDIFWGDLGRLEACLRAVEMPAVSSEFLRERYVIDIYCNFFICQCFLIDLMS